MKNIYFVVVALLIWSCDTRFSQIPDLNTPPTLTFTNGTNTLRDSLKTGLNIKWKKVPYDFGLIAYDRENHLEGINYTIAGSKFGTSLFTYNGANVPDGNIPFETSGSLSMKYLPKDSTGNIRLTFTLVDNFQATSTATLDLFVFRNLDPIASIAATKNNLDGPYSAILDASASYDQDKSQGGAIQYYVFTVIGTNGAYPDIIETQPTIPFVFPGAGGYTVKVKTIDFDGGSSTAQTSVTF